MARVTGRNLSLTFDDVEVACVSSSVQLENEDADAELVTFADVIAGNDRRWFLSITSYPDYAAGSWWTLLWEIPAYTAIPYLFKPYGNAVATPDRPHFAGFVTVDKKPPLGGDAGSVWTFETRLSCTARPARIVSEAA